jgi:hypothetical protein
MDALRGDRNTSRMQSLSGLWKFNFVEKSSDRPSNFISKDFNGEALHWKDILGIKQMTLKNLFQSHLFSIKFYL